MVGASGCHPAGNAPLYSGAPVPAIVFDAPGLEHFYSLGPDPAPATRARVLADGRVEPGGVTSPDEYFPASYCNEIKTRLDLRSFPSFLALPPGSGILTHAGQGWEETHMDDTSCAFASGLGSCAYNIVAGFDYTGDGRRDWLVASAQQPVSDDAPLVILWLLVENPGPEGPLPVRLLGFEERYGIADATAVMGEGAGSALRFLQQKFARQ